MKKLHALVILFFMISLFPTHYASAEERTIEINYAGIKIVVNGIDFIPINVNGVRVDPFTYNGTTYLPVRAVCTALGKSVNWDGNTKTVAINNVEADQNADASSQSGKSDNASNGNEQNTNINMNYKPDDTDESTDDAVDHIAIPTIDPAVQNISVPKENDLTQTSEVNEQIPSLAGSHNVKVSFDKISILINGSTIDPRDASGNPALPFIYDGSVYLPVRAIGEAFGLSVNWHGKTSTIYIGK